MQTFNRDDGSIALRWEIEGCHEKVEIDLDVRNYVLCLVVGIRSAWNWNVDG
jgi:hypothetical protein